MASADIDQIETRWLASLLLGLTLLGGFLRFYELDVKSFWSDELISLCHAKMIHDLESFLTPQCGNAHPPLYFLIFKAWSVFGEGEFYSRLLSVIFGTAAISAAFFLGRELTGTYSGLVTSFLVAISPFHLLYDREVRMYSLLTLLTVVSLYCFLKALRTGRGVYWALYATLSAASMYVHYHALLVILVEWVFFIAGIRRYRHLVVKAALSQVLIAAVGVWWLPGFIFQVQHPELFTLDSADKFPVAALSWLLKPIYVLIAFSLGQSILPWNPAAIAGGIIFSVLVVLGVKRLQDDRESALFIGLSLCIPFVVASLISQTMPRYFVFLAPLYYLIVAKGILFSPRKWIRAGVLCLIVIPISVSVSNYYHNREFHILAHVDPWREVAEYIRSNSRSMDCIVAIGSSMPLAWYLDDFRQLSHPIYSVNFKDSKECMDNDQTRRAWLVTSDSNLEAISQDARSWFGDRYKLLDEKKLFRDPEYKIKSKLFKKPFLRYRIIVSLYGNS
jgi:4-amino-4-deoxy-L-arabinose transferase-like glycosyltransferase